MVTRVSTLFQNQTSLRNLQQTNSAMELTTYQITSGQKARTLADLGTDATKVLTLRDVQARTGVYAENITSATNTLKASEQALQDMSDLISQATSLATQGTNENSAATRASLAPQGQALAEAFYTAYKTQYNGKYLFSGMNGDTAPVAGSASSTAFPGSPVSTSWYQGDNQTPQVMTGPGTSMNYGVTGDDSAFANLKAAMESLWYGLQNNSTTDMDQAISALQSAKTEISGLLGTIGGQIDGLKQITERLDQQKTFTQEQLDGVEKVDVASALTTYSQQQATLQASMMIISQSQQLTLLDYIR